MIFVSFIEKNMKTIISLRFLCVLGFMLLICPFYDSCNDRGMNKEVDNEKSEKSFLSPIEDFIDDGDSQNAYEIGAMSWMIFTCGFECQLNGLKSSIAQNDYNEIFFGTTNACFALIVILTFLNLVFVFTKKINLVARFSKWILILLMIAIICILIEKQFKEISQVKWGFYCFAFVNGLIFYFSRRFLKLKLSEL